MTDTAMRAAGHGYFVGLCTLDSVHRLARLPGRNEKVRSAAHHLAAGGPAANAAVTFAALGGRSTLLTALGGHPLARLAADELTGRGVRVLDAVPEYRAPPPVSSVLVEADSGDRTVASRNDAGMHAALTGEPPGLETADVLLVDGHHPGLARNAARAAHARGVPVLLDGGSWKPGLTELLPLLDAAACSADFRTPGASTVPGSARALLDHGVGRVLVTDGPHPVRWWTAEGCGTVPVPRVPVRDTLGAGDVFHGALARAWPCGLVEAIGHACAVAAVRVGVPGPRDWLDTPELARLAAEPW